MYVIVMHPDLAAFSGNENLNYLAFVWWIWVDIFYTLSPAPVVVYTKSQTYSRNEVLLSLFHKLIEKALILT